MNQNQADSGIPNRFNPTGKCSSAAARKPSDMAILIEAGSPAIELVAGAGEDDLAAAIDDVSGGIIVGDQIELARALGFCAGLALQLRQALRLYCGVTTVEAIDGR
jgi:hypothetical protein